MVKMDLNGRLCRGAWLGMKTAAISHLRRSPQPLLCGTDLTEMNYKKDTRLL